MGNIYEYGDEVCPENVMVELSRNERGLASNNSNNMDMELL